MMTVVVWRLCCLALLVVLGGRGEEMGLMPEFVKEVPNITVTVGRDAHLPCTVEQLKGYKVAWVQVDSQTILTIHKQVITRNPRIALLHNDHRSWHLEIKNVREGDRGWYMCQVNTDPMRSKQGYVDVVVPPDIIDRESSGDITVREGQNVTLTCRAKGHPEPTIVWRREDNKAILHPTSNGWNSSIQSVSIHSDDLTSKAEGSSSVAGNPERGVDVIGALGAGSEEGTAARVVHGQTLVLKKVSRLQMANYLCIASNGVPPSISKRAILRVQFPPMTWVPQQLEGAYVGQELTIECHTEAYPKSINYWTNPKEDMVVTGKRLHLFFTEDSYKVYMKLKILAVAPEDFGTFRCVAKNSLGETDGFIRIYEINPPKSHRNRDSDVTREGSQSQGSYETTTTIIPIYNKEPRKYQNSWKPKGINDIIEQHHSRSYDNKEHSHRGQASLHDHTAMSNPERGCGGRHLAALFLTLLYPAATLLPLLHLYL